jgi:hypothetical protein
LAVGDDGERIGGAELAVVVVGFDSLDEGGFAFGDGGAEPGRFGSDQCGDGSGGGEAEGPQVEPVDGWYVAGKGAGGRVRDTGRAEDERVG